jgi:DNA transformation protein
MSPEIIYCNLYPISQPMDTTPKLEDLPNIGRTLACLLNEAGINTPDDLYIAGAIQVFIRIRAIDPDACFSKLCALEGAIQGIRWHTLSPEKKTELQHFFTMAKK